MRVPIFFPMQSILTPRGASILAHSVYEALTGNFGGLQVEEGYGDHMVLPHGEPLHLRGKANRGEEVTLQFGKLRLQAIADVEGDWSISIPAQKPGGPYVLRFSTANRTVELRDVLFGELWLASGQSNMDFPVSKSSEAGEAMQMAGQQIRLLHYRNAAPTDPIAWNQETLKKVNQLHYFSGEWETANAGNASDFSAVAYFFAQRLYKKLGVPIGIVQVSVGGSGAESWISRRTIEDDPQLVDMLVNWRDSDFIMRWCRERAAENLAHAGSTLQQHPYAPSYNFEAGIAPILHLPIKGVIWYQGESNTQNLELYEHLFPTLVSDWRKRWGRDLPFFYVQLSGLNRPSWPRFRDAQRRLAETVPNSGMVVSSDLGEENDVHYHHKKAIGERLANLALERIYRVADVHGESPIGFKASRTGRELKIEFKNSGERLRTSDGLAARGFELRDSEGNWHVVTAQVAGKVVLLDDALVDGADAVAYAWQPFPNANLANAYGLPASTFFLEISQ
ncbi:MAG: sialate O-acetylesterase [Edaphobacter sp.]|uniref:sialate O-acetylesterase n=1 Tax=Edaphobacter sp. TaxID=1934404 RepID=UPI00239D33E0|nr:sialate O-acetylesterase [Edaphobacter sp.]MDE1178219.1 sialate O-acetylesterase [Edaphobacter sp.]